MLQTLTEAADQLLAILLEATAKRPSLWDESKHVGFTIVGPDVHNPPDIETLLPFVQTLERQFNSFAVTQRAAAILESVRTRVAWVRNNRDALEEELKAIGTGIEVLDRVTALQRDFKDDYDGGLFNARREVTRWDRLLWADQISTKNDDDPEERKTTVAKKIVGLPEEQRDAAITNAIGTGTNQAARAASLMLELRCLDNVYSRFRVASRVHAQTKAPLSNILALWRTEGDLALPPTMESLTGEDVPQTAGQDVPLPPGRINQQYILGTRPHLYTTVMIADAQKLIDNGRTDAAGLAVTLYHLLLMGLDVLFSPDLKWRELNARGTQTQIDADAVRELVRGGKAPKLYDLLVVRQGTIMVGPDTRMCHVIAPKETGKLRSTSDRKKLDGAVEHAASIVSEGVYILQWILQQGTLPWARSANPRVKAEPLMPIQPGETTRRSLPQILAYSMYHMGLHRAPGLWASAIAHSGGLRPSSAESKALNEAVQQARTRTGIAAADFEKLKRKIKAADNDQVYEVARDHWDSVLLPLFKPDPSPAVLDRLAAFLLRTGDDKWHTFLEVRQNLVRYTNLQRFYAKLFNEP